MPTLSSRAYPSRRCRQDPACPALRFFGSFTLREARDAAHEVLAAAARCEKCRAVLAARTERVGSTLFFDDDPRKLTQMFDPRCRDACTLRLLAACIVTYGRERVAA